MNATALDMAQKIGSSVADTNKVCSNGRGRENECSSSLEPPA